MPAVAQRNGGFRVTELVVPGQRLVIQQSALSAGGKRRQFLLPVLNDGFGGHDVSDPCQSVFVGEKPAVGVKVPGAFVVRRQVSGNREAEAQGFRKVGLKKRHTDTTTVLVHKLAGVGCEANRLNFDSFEFHPIQLFRQSIAIQPGRSQHLERCFGAPTNRKIGGFKQADAGVKHSRFQAPHVWRRINPGQSGVSKIVSPSPVLDRNNVKFELRDKLGLKQRCQFSDGHTVTHRDLMKANKRLGAFVEYGAINRNAINGVGPVQNHKFNVAFSRRLHRETHCRYVGVKTRAYVLNIEYQCIDATKHGGGRLPVFSVQAINLKAGAGVFGIVNVGGIENALDAMFGAEDRIERDIRRSVQELDRARAMSVDARVITNQADFLSCKRVKVIGLQDIDSCLHRLAAAQLRFGATGVNKQRENDDEIKWESSHSKQHNVSARLASSGGRLVCH